MAYFPLFVDLTEKDILIVGGGATATRKAKVLLRFDAFVTILSPDLSEELHALVSDGKIRWIPERFSAPRAEEKPYSLIIAATDDGAVNRVIAASAQNAGIPINCVDDVENSTFLFPSVVKDGDVVAGISTGGKSPIISRELRKRIEAVYPDNIGETNEQMADLRRTLRKEIPGDTQEAQKRRKEALEKAWNPEE